MRAKTTSSNELWMRMDGTGGNGFCAMQIHWSENISLHKCIFLSWEIHFTIWTQRQPTVMSYKWEKMAVEGLGFVQCRYIRLRINHFTNAFFILRNTFCDLDIFTMRAVYAKATSSNELWMRIDGCGGIGHCAWQIHWSQNKLLARSQQQKR